MSDESTDARSEAYLFAEEKEAFGCIRAIAQDAAATDNEESLARFRRIVDKYLECPTLLDPSLQAMVQPLCDTVTATFSNGARELSLSTCTQNCLSALYALSKVRGRKTIQRFFPHRVDDVQVIWNALSVALAVSDSNVWESVYILWHWMAALSLVPFDCQVLMGDEWLDRLLNTAREHLTDAGPTREAASACLAAWLSRPDTDSVQWDVFLAWAQNDVIVPYKDMGSSKLFFPLLGVLQTLTTLLKSSTMERGLLVERLYQPMWDPLLELSQVNDTLLLSQKLVKWWTRMACAHLPPRVAPWRYQRGKRSLTENLSHSRNEKPVSTAETDVLDQEELFHVPDLVEDATGRILDALGHSSTVVRWSAAKGIGRITERLPALCGEDILDAVLEYFEDIEKDRCWHGACLALAELARRGLLLPNRLKDVVSRIVQSIAYDQRRGSTSVGAHVRDAACYTYWAFARSYSPAVLRPFLKDLSEAIVLTSLFDREVNCRRAASAAFQEAVGRQGADNFPNGIAILTTADYFSLGNRSGAYKKIAWTVARFDEYRRPIICHLYTEKLFHWDIVVRKLTAEALHGLVDEDVNYFCSVVLPSLMEKSLDMKNLHVRHGAVLGVAEITLALAESRELAALSAKHTETLTMLVPAIEKKRLYRGRGGEIMRSAVCRLVECIALARLPLAVKDQVRLLDSVDASIPHPSEVIQNDACAALEQLMISFFPVSEKGPTPRLQARVVDKFVNLCTTSDNPAATRGYTLALGHLPPKLLAPTTLVLNTVLECLIKIARPDSLVGGEGDAETRRNASWSLKSLAEKVGFSPCTPAPSHPVVYLNKAQAMKLFEALLLAMNDYRSDRRGDVGSWCRIKGMDALTALLPLASAALEGEVVNGLTIKVVGAMLKQLAEKLDSVRQRSGECLTTILRNPSIPGIVGRDELVEALQISCDIAQNWSEAQSTFPKLGAVACIEEKNDVYVDNVLAGLVLSIGGLTETVSTQASQCLLQWIKKGDAARREKVWNFLLSTLKRHKGSRRLILPTLKTINLLLTHKLFDDLVRSKDKLDYCQDLLEREAADCRDIHRLFAIVDVSVSLLSASGEYPAQTLAFLCNTLGHQYPRVRSHAAHQFYVSLLDWSAGDPSTEERILDIVLNTPWAAEDFHDQKKHLGELVDLLGIREDFDRAINRRD